MLQVGQEGGGDIGVRVFGYDALRFGVFDEIVPAQADPLVV